MRSAPCSKAGSDWSLRTARSHEYVAGDTFYNSKGEVWNWTVIEPVRKIFHIHDPDSDELAH